MTQPGVTQPGVTPLEVPQPGVAQMGATQLLNILQRMAYDIVGLPGVSGYNTAHPPGPPPPNHPAGHSFHPLSQPAGVSVQPHQCMPPGSQTFGKFNLHHLSLYNFHVWCIDLYAGSPGAAGYTPGPSPPHYVHRQPRFRPSSAQFPMMGIKILQYAFMCLYIKYVHVECAYTQLYS